MKRIAALSVLSLALLAIATLTLTASPKISYEFSADGRFVSATNAPVATIPGPLPDAQLKTIASNFSTYPLATYFSIWGNTIAQGGANFPFQAWVADAFTPTADATVTKIEVSAGRQGGGFAGFEIGLYSDAGGIPGTVLKSVHIPGSKLSIYGQCCAVTTANLGAGVKVKAGTQYWVAVTTTPSDTDIYAWAFNSTNMSGQLEAGWCSGSQQYCGSNNNMWVPISYVQHGFAVFGK